MLALAVSPNANSCVGLGLCPTSGSRLPIPVTPPRRSHPLIETRMPRAEVQ